MRNCVLALLIPWIVCLSPGPSAVLRPQDAGITITRAPGGPMKIPMGGFVENSKSELVREWVTIHDSNLPADLVETTGVNVSYSENGPGWLRFLSQLNPLTYVIDGKIENLQLPNRAVTGTWKNQKESGAFKMTRQ